MEILGNIKKLTKNKLITVFSLVVISIGIIGGCGGGSEAPFGSTLTFIVFTEDIQLCTDGFEPRLFQVVVTDAEGSPLNDVLMCFDLVFGTENSFLIDTDGNGIGDARLFQMVDNDACSPKKCMNTPIEEWFLSGAFVDSPYETITNNSGVAEVVIIIPGAFNIPGQFLAADPTTLTAFSGANATSLEITVNSDCEVPVF